MGSMFVCFKKGGKNKYQECCTSQTCWRPSGGRRTRGYIGGRGPTPPGAGRRAQGLLHLGVGQYPPGLPGVHGRNGERETLLYQYIETGTYILKVSNSC